MRNEASLPVGARASMEPASLAVRYVVCETVGADDVPKAVGLLESDAFADCANSDIALEVSGNGESFEVAVRAQKPVMLDQMQIRLRHAFATDEKVLFNGYQSWTDTVERPAWGFMRGLHGVPGKLVERYALDGLGDYALVDYNLLRGHQHGFTYATFRRGEGMVLVGSLDETRGFTVIGQDAPNGLVTLNPECPARVLEAGERAVLARFAIVRGMQETCFDRWFTLSGAVGRARRPLVGFTSWYRHYGGIDAEKLQVDLEGAARFFASIETGDERGDGPVGGAGGAGAGGAGATGAEPACGAGVQPATAGPAIGSHAVLAVAELADGAHVLPLKVFQIDDGYCKVGDWLDVDEAKFPQGLASFADRIRAAGFLPGLWIAPFVCERDSKLAHEHEDWLLRDGSGELVRTGSHWSGAFALDTRNVEVRSYVLEVLQTIVREWGYGLIKADFLYAACMRAHDGLNHGELMADALALLRRGVGRDTLILGCGVPLGSAFGVVDYCRIGCDVGLDWDDVPHMRLLHRERVSTKNSLANTYGRAPLDGLGFGNDPDVFYLRDNVHINRARRDELLFADAEFGSVLLTSDDMGKWEDAERQRYLEALRILCAK